MENLSGKKDIVEEVFLLRAKIEEWQEKLTAILALPYGAPQYFSLIGVSKSIVDFGHEHDGEEEGVYDVGKR